MLHMLEPWSRLTKPQLPAKIKAPRLSNLQTPAGHTLHCAHTHCVTRYLCAISFGVPGHNYSVFSTVFTQERVLRTEKYRRESRDSITFFEQIRHLTTPWPDTERPAGSYRHAFRLQVKKDSERRPQTLKWEGWALTGVGVCASE